MAFSINFPFNPALHAVNRLDLDCEDFSKENLMKSLLRSSGFIENSPTEQNPTEMGKLTLQKSLVIKSKALKRSHAPIPPFFKSGLSSAEKFKEVIFSHDKLSDGLVTLNTLRVKICGL
jgi:hypothetical protein